MDTRYILMDTRLLKLRKKLKEIFSTLKVKMIFIQKQLKVIKLRGY